MTLSITLSLLTLSSFTTVLKSMLPGNKVAAGHVFTLSHFSNKTCTFAKKYSVSMLYKKLYFRFFI